MNSFQFKCSYAGDLQDFPFSFMLERNKYVYFNTMKCIYNISFYLLLQIVVMKIFEDKSFLRGLVEL